MLDYETLALSRLTGQFDKAIKLKNLIAAMVAPLAIAENEGDALSAQRWIDTAIGKQLDGCGYIVGEPRLGRNDDDYREAIKFRIFANTSNGTPGDLIFALKAISEPTDCQYLESHPATAILFTDGLFAKKSIQALMQSLAPAGIADVPVAVSFRGKPFRFAENPLPGELFANDSYLTANTSDIQVSENVVVLGSSTLGGVVPAELDVGIGYLNVGGPTLAVYSPNHLHTLGHYNLTGVFQ